MGKFTKLEKEDEVIKMIAGEFRKRDVQVGNYIAPLSDVIDTVFNYYEKEYSSIFATSTKAIKLLAALSSHHRLVYLHPFLDGLRLDQLNDKIRKFVKFSQEGIFYKQESLPKYSELLFSHLLLNGELQRKYVPFAIGKSVSTATKLVSTLTKMGYLESEHSKAPLRLKVNSFFASQIIPELILQKLIPFIKS